MRSITKILTVTAIALAGIVAPTTTAHASASGCTRLGSWVTDTVCINVSGSGTYVTRAKASFIAPAARPCNTKLYITWFDLKGRKYSQSISSLSSKCLSGRTHSQTYGATMREGRACGAVSINGVMKPGACVSIRK